MGIQASTGQTCFQQKMRLKKAEQHAPSLVRPFRHETGVDPPRSPPPPDQAFDPFSVIRRPLPYPPGQAHPG